MTKEQLADLSCEMYMKSVKDMAEIMRKHIIMLEKQMLDAHQKFKDEFISILGGE